MKTTIALTARLWCAALLLLALEVRAGETPRPPARVAPTDGVVSSIYGPYVYDPTGNVIAIGSDVPASNSFVYDPMSRVTSATVIHEGYPQSQTYEYDAYGNRTKAGSQTYPVTAANRLSSMNAQYDPAGNLIRWQPPGSAYIRSYDYDALNMMTREKITTASGERSVVHVYTVDDERYSSVDTFTNGTKLSRFSVRNLDGKVLRVFTNDAGGTWQNPRDFIYRDDLLLASVSGTTTYHYSLDHLGTPRIVTDATGKQASRRAYFPFGAELTSGTSAPDGPLRFTGHERDADLNNETNGVLDYMHARYYSSNMGRFLSVDPGQPDAKRPQSWNQYAYVANRPLAYIDPDGKDALAVAFPDFKITVGKAKVPYLGHAGVVVIDKNGRTKYYEYGRYDPLGKVRRRAVPDVQIGSNGRPTKASMDRLMSALSQTAGQGGRVQGAYFINDKSAEMHAYAQKVEAQNGDPNRQKYNLITNSCNTFVQNVLEAGDVDTPWMVDPRPNSYIDELQRAADFRVNWTPKGIRPSASMLDPWPIRGAIIDGVWTWFTQ